MHQLISNKKPRIVQIGSETNRSFLVLVYMPVGAQSASRHPQHTTHLLCTSMYIWLLGAELTLSHLLEANGHQRCPKVRSFLLSTSLPLMPYIRPNLFFLCFFKSVSLWIPGIQKYYVSQQTTPKGSSSSALVTQLPQSPNSVLTQNPGIKKFWNLSKS